MATSNEKENGYRNLDTSDITQYKQQLNLLVQYFTATIWELQPEIAT